MKRLGVGATSVAMLLTEMRKRKGRRIATEVAPTELHSTPLAPAPNAVNSRVMISFGDSATSGKSPTAS